MVSVSSEEVPPTRRRRGVIIAALATLGLLVWGTAVVIAVVKADSLDHSGLALVAKGIGTNLLSSPQRTKVKLRTAHSDFAQAQNALDAPYVIPLRVVPVLGRQLRSATDLSGAASTLSGTALWTLDSLQGDLGQTSSDQMGRRLPIVTKVAATLQSASRNIDSINLGPSQGLLAPLSAARARLAGVLIKIKSTLDTASSASSALSRLLNSHSNILILPASSAEMRNGSGSFLSAAELTTDAGHPRLVSVSSTNALQVPSVAVRLPAPIAQRWALFDPGKRIDALGFDPSFPDNAKVAAEIWAAVKKSKATTVVAIDAVGIRALMNMVGPISLNGSVLDSNNVVYYLMQGQYAGQPAGGGSLESRSNALLGDLAAQIFNKLLTGKLDLRGSMTNLLSALAGRHLMIWSSDPRLQRAWTQIGASGTVFSNDLMVGIANLGSNKLDGFLRVKVDLSLNGANPAGKHGGTDGSLLVTVTNTAPKGPASLIEGPRPPLTTLPGEYLGALVVTFPGDLKSAQVIGSPSILAAGRQGPTNVLSPLINVGPGSTVKESFVFKLANQHGQIAVIPSARIPPIVWNWGVHTWTDSSPVYLKW